MMKNSGVLTGNIILLVCIVITQTVTAVEWTPSIWQDFLINGSQSQLPDFSYAGYHCGEVPIPNIPVVASVVFYGAIPDDGNDDTFAIQTAIDAGGGAVYFPAGQYDINVDNDPNKFLRVNNSNVVLRGAGSGTNGTILHLHNLLEEGSVIFVGWNESATSWGTLITDVTADVSRGSNILTVADTSGLLAGEVVHLTQRNTGGVRNLTDYLLSPLPVDPNWTNTYNSGTNGYTYFKWLVEIKEIIDSTHIRLKQPVREEIRTLWEPHIFRPSFLEEIGIENMRFASSWTSEYTHHGSSEVDYYWPAISLRNVINGWVRNVVIDDYTVPIELSFCKNVTVQDVNVVGKPGHFGVLVGGHDCMVEDITLDAPRTHALTVNNYSQGNVLRNVVLNYSDGSGGCYQALDYHCNFSMENLMECITNARVQSGGDTVNLPHCSHRNTFWNIKSDEMHTPYGEDNGQEFFVTYAWQGRNDDHKMYPGSIVVGAYHDTITLEIEESSADRDNEWIYVEGFNQPDVNPSSLYEAQFQLRVPCTTYGALDLNKDCYTNLYDFAVMAADWYNCSDPNNTDCGEYWNDPCDPNYP